MAERPCRRCGGSGVEVDPVETGREMRALREAAGLSLREMARRMGYSVQYISDLERGQREWRAALMQPYRDLSGQQQEAGR